MFSNIFSDDLTDEDLAFVLRLNLRLCCGTNRVLAVHRCQHLILKVRRVWLRCFPFAIWHLH